MAGRLIAFLGSGLNCKAILTVINPEILEAARPLQLCAGPDSGCEAAVHTIRHLFSDSNTESLLLVDASNAFNSLNCEVALCMSYTCVFRLSHYQHLVQICIFVVSLYMYMYVP